MANAHAEQPLHNAPLDTALELYRGEAAGVETFDFGREKRTTTDTANPDRRHMDVISRTDDLKGRLHGMRRAGKRIGFAPTMGALHAGHVALIEAASRDCEVTVMSIYVNPSQFGPTEDFSRYPRDPRRDRELAAQAGLDILFTPTDAEMYPGGPEEQKVWVDPGGLGSVLEGERRPGHFRGVATVVAKLFQLVRPDAAYFGQKDAQQALVIQRLARDLNTGIEIHIIPTVREPDGLALSSRNAYLDVEQRRQAPAIYRGLATAQAAFSSGERNPASLRAIVETTIRQDAPLASVQYVAVNDADGLSPLTEEVTEPALLSLAVFSARPGSSTTLR